MTPLTRFTVGEQVRYIIPANRTQGILYQELPAVVTKITETRVVILVEGTHRPRAVAQFSLAPLKIKGSE